MTDTEVYKLCYVDPDNGLCFFANVEPTQVWGDDWNDAPYEHNAGQPYTHREWKVRAFAPGIYLDQPHDYTMNSTFSVEQINRGVIAWLRTYDCTVLIFAGTELEEFKRIIGELGGNVEEIAEPADYDDDADD